MKKLKLSMVLGFLICLCYSNVYGYLSYNKSECSFEGECQEPDGPAGVDSSMSFRPSLEQLIIDGAGYFLQSNSLYQQLQNKIELSAAYGVNYQELTILINGTIENMELAHAVYYDLWETSQSFDYNTWILNNLKNFCYSTFQSDHNLNSVVFNQVADMLKAGDVRGTYKKVHDATGDILDRLQSIKTAISSKQIPAIPECWRTTQLYFETQLFGQYVSEVFFEIAE